MVTKSRERLADLDYDFDALAELMRKHGLITVQLVWPESRKRYHSRNPFAGSGVVEDPATGASAAAFGGYLRELGMIGESASFKIIQGVDMGQPGEINVSVIGGESGVRVGDGPPHRGLTRDKGRRTRRRGRVRGVRPPACTGPAPAKHRSLF